jgi:hypothetical protein
MKEPLLTYDERIIVAGIIIGAVGVVLFILAAKALEAI